jgi:hypothetical protein
MKTIEKQSLFWDVNLDEIDEKKHRDFIVQRILMLGDVDDLKWATDAYGAEIIRDIFQKSYQKMDFKSRNFWCFYFNLEKEKCNQMQSTNKRGMFWRN